MERRDQGPGFGSTIGIGAGIGAGLGIVGALLLGADISGGIWLGAIFGFLIGLLVDWAGASRHPVG
jgi:hypothetical protein